MGIGIFGLGAFLLLSNCATTNPEEKPVWERTLQNGAFSQRWDFVSLEFQGKMWVIGGSDYNDQRLNDVWSSDDGRSWTRVTDSAAFLPRDMHKGTVFQNRMWIIGGSKRNGGFFFNDVWSSDDGINWIGAIDSAPFSPRGQHAVLSYNNKIWVIGGWENGVRRKNDVWSSDDGTSWQLVESNAAFSPRSDIKAIVWQNKMWVISGVSTGTSTDVWSSVDGITWIKEADSLRWLDKDGLQTITVARDSLWMIGGLGPASMLDFVKDTWKSGDGRNWTQVQPDPEFPARAGHGALVFKNRLWVIGGLGRQSVLNDVWATSDSTYYPPP